MTVTEAVLRLCADPSFWTQPTTPAPADNAAVDPADAPADDAAELRVSFPVAGGYGLVLDVHPGTGEQHLGLRIPTTDEPLPLAWTAPDQPPPAALRWWELDLCARVVALADPTLPHPGLVVALLSPFAPATPDDDWAAITAVREAAYRSLRRADPEPPSRPEQEPLPMFTGDDWWPHPSDQLLDEVTIAELTAPRPVLSEVRGDPRFPARDLAQLLNEAAERLTRLRGEPGYAQVRPLAREIVASGDLTGVRGMVGVLTEAGCDHPTVLDALSEPLVATEACWMVETLAGAEPGELLRHHV